MKIDIGFHKPIVTYNGPSGVCFLQGSNKIAEYIHHLLPFAARRERKWGRQVAWLVVSSPEMIHTLAGHSLGGTVVCEAIKFLSNHRLIFTYGAKRPANAMSYGTHYAVKGDPVPHLPPWRPALPTIVLDYGKLNIVEAHGPRAYYEQMAKDGVR